MTPKQKKVYKYIEKYIHNNGIAPTYEEIMAKTGIKHKSVLSQYLLRLEIEGKIIRHKARTRGIELKNKKDDLIQVIKILLKVSPEHRDWIAKNWKDILEEIEK